MPVLMGLTCIFKCNLQAQIKMSYSCAMRMSNHVTRQFTKTECLFTLSPNSLSCLAEAIYTNSAHQRVIGLAKIKL